MKHKALTSSAISLALLGLALLALFGLTSLDIGPAQSNEVTSVAGDAPDPEEEAVDEAADETTELETSAAPEPVELAEAEPVAEVAGTTSLQTAGAITFTGDAEVDFPASNPDVIVIQDPGGIDVGNAPKLQPTLSGHEIADLRFFYDSTADELFVAINFLGVGGDPEGDGDPNTGRIPDPDDPDNEEISLGTDQPSWAGTETFVVLLDLDGDGEADIAAGLPFQQDISAFSVNEALPSARFNPPFAFGASRPELRGTPAADTSTTSPDIEFSLASFSSIASTDQATIGVLGFSGSLDDGGIGEESVSNFGALIEVPNPVFGSPELTIEKSTNGVDADTAVEGPSLVVGSEATFLYEVANTGDVDLVNITVTDDVLGPVCSIGFLAVDAADTCEATATVTAGDYVNIGTASGFEDDGTGNPTGDPVTATDPSHHTGLVSGISVVKTINGQDANIEADAVTLDAGATATFEFLITNTGDLALADLALEDDVLGTIDCDLADGFVLPVGESVRCSATAPAGVGLITNIATVTAQPVDTAGNEFGATVTADDPANHIGVVLEPGISVVKTINGEDANTEMDAVELDAGATAEFAFVVANIGQLDLVDIALEDDVLGTINCPSAELAVNTEMTCTATASAGVGLVTNTATATAQPIDASGNPTGDPVAATDPANHVGVCANFFQGPVLYKGARTIWNTNLVVGDDSTIVLTTSENGGSPGQPNEQVYVEVAGVQYGPSPVGLGTITLDIEEGGQVRVLHISEVDEDIRGANSVVPSLCGDDLAEIVPVCTNLLQGTVLHAFADTVWETGLVAEDGSTIRIVTEENGGSPGQPNEQVYLQVGTGDDADLYGPTFAGLGDSQFEIGDGGPVTISHYSEVTDDRSSANSVVPSICGDDLAPEPAAVCPTTVSGPRMFQGNITVWDSGLTAVAGSEITITTSDSISDLIQPNEQVYLQVGDVVYEDMPTPAGRGEITIPITNTGELTILHYSEVNGRQSSVNSVDYEFCGTGLTRTVPGYVSELYVDEI